MAHFIPDDDYFDRASKIQMNEINPKNMDTQRDMQLTKLVACMIMREFKRGLD